MQLKCIINSGNKNSTWNFVVEIKPRNIFEIPTNEWDVSEEEEAQHGYT